MSIRMSPSLWKFPPTSTPSYPSRLSQSTCLSSWSHSANSHQLSILHTVVRVFPFYSLHSYYPLPPQLHVSTICSLSLHLHCCPANRFIGTIFLDSIYTYIYIYMCVCVYDICFSLSDLLHSLKSNHFTLQVHPPPQN